MEEESRYEYLVNIYETTEDLYGFKRKIRINDFIAISTAIEKTQDWEELEPILEQLKVASKSSDHFMIRELLLKLVPEFRPQCGIEDYLYKDKT